VQKALVLAGGGVTGIAWETGVLLGLRDAGVDLVADADLVVGTSAGSTVAAQVLSGTDLAELDAVQQGDEHQEITPELDFGLLATIFSELAGGRLPDQEARARIGALALTAETVDEATRRAVIEARLPSHDWPARRLLVTAVDALTGELAVFDAASGVSLVDAVAASCAVPGVWPPVSIGERRYVDGGVRSTANADLAAGHDVVVVLAPLSGPAASTLDPEVAALRSGGATVVVVATDPDAAEAMGLNPLDPDLRRPSAEHGRRQGLAAAEAVGGSWLSGEATARPTG
jgi:NTE family protein